MTQEAFDETARVAASQKALILATTLALIDIFFLGRIWIAAIAFPVIVWAGWKTALAINTGSRWLWLAALLFPVFTPVAAIVLSERTTEYLRARGRRVYLLGVWDPKHVLQSVAAIVVLALVVVGAGLLRVAGGRLSWTEEVRLSDGRTIVVDRSNRYDDVGWTKPASSGLFQRARLAFATPRPIIHLKDWEGSAQPLILDVRDGKAYLVAIVTSYSGVEEFGKPDPGYVAFVFSGDHWKRIDLKDLPSGLSVNLLVLPRADLVRHEPVSISTKERAKAQDRVPDQFRRLDPAYRLRY